MASFPFDGNANDASGNGNHGTVFGASLTTDRFGNSDSAYRFDGIDDYIQANADNLPTGDRTVALWFQADRLDNRPGLIGYGGGSCGTSWWMGINNGAADRQYQMQGHCLVNRIRSGYGPAPIGRWTHWLVTTDATGTRSYIDGIEHGSNLTFVNNTNVAGKDFSLGVMPSSTGISPYTDVNLDYFDGQLDDVAVYDRSLSIGEIQDAAEGNLPTDYVLFYPFNGNAMDESSGSNDGFVVGATLTEDRSGNPQGAYDFDGVDDYIVADSEGLPTGERTVSLWFRAESLEGHPSLLGYGGGTCGSSWLMGINVGTDVNQYQVTGHCNANTLLTGFAPEPTLEWHHWAVTTNLSGTRIFVDGVQLAKDSNHVTNTAVAGRDLAIGTIVDNSGFAPFTDANSGYFDGKLDEILIYDRALGYADLQILVEEGTGALIFADGFESGNISQWALPR